MILTFMGLRLSTNSSIISSEVIISVAQHGLGHGGTAQGGRTGGVEVGDQGELAGGLEGCMHVAVGLISYCVDFQKRWDKGGKEWCWSSETAVDDMIYHIGEADSNMGLAIVSDGLERTRPSRRRMSGTLTSDCTNRRIGTSLGD